MILSFPDYKEQALRVAKMAGLACSTININHFPDGESLITFPCDITDKEVYFYISLDNPNEKLIELIFAAYSARNKAKKIGLIAPYLCYMRQDKEFNKGEVVSADIMAELFKVFDHIITVDPHLHRIRNLSDLFTNQADRITSTLKLSSYIRENFRNPVIIGPDEESFQWAKEVASYVGCPAHIFKKKRISSEKVIIDAKITDVEEKDLIIVDDIISTGHTMEEMIKDMKECGAHDISCIAVHGIFAEDSYSRLKKAGAEIITTNTVPNKTSKIDITELIAEKIK